MRDRDVLPEVPLVHATDLVGSSSRLSDCASSRLAGWIGTTSLPPMRRKNWLCAWGGGVYEVDLTTLRGCSQLAVTSSGESCFFAPLCLFGLLTAFLVLGCGGFYLFPVSVWVQSLWRCPFFPNF